MLHNDKFHLKLWQSLFTTKLLFLMMYFRARSAHRGKKHYRDFVLLNYILRSVEAVEAVFGYLNCTETRGQTHTDSHSHRHGHGDGCRVKYEMWRKT